MSDQDYGTEVFRKPGPVWKGKDTTFEDKKVRDNRHWSKVDAQGTEWWWDEEKGTWMR